MISINQNYSSTI